jgi:uncharacterized protein YdcH (DUF465 family)
MAPPAGTSASFTPSSALRPSNRGPGRTSAKTSHAIRDLLRDGDNEPKGTAPMEKAIAEELESKHAALHALIEEEEHRAHPDEDLLHRLKKEKLKLKDEIAGHMMH